MLNTPSQPPLAKSPLRGATNSSPHRSAANMSGGSSAEDIGVGMRRLVGDLVHRQHHAHIHEQDVSRVLGTVHTTVSRSLKQIKTFQCKHQRAVSPTTAMAARDCHVPVEDEEEEDEYGNLIEPPLPMPLYPMVVSACPEWKEAPHEGQTNTCAKPTSNTDHALLILHYENLGWNDEDEGGKVAELNGIPFPMVAWRLPRLLSENEDRACARLGDIREGQFQDLRPSLNIDRLVNPVDGAVKDQLRALRQAAGDKGRVLLHLEYRGLVGVSEADGGGGVPGLVLRTVQGEPTFITVSELVSACPPPFTILLDSSSAGAVLRQFYTHFETRGGGQNQGGGLNKYGRRSRMQLQPSGSGIFGGGGSTAHMASDSDGSDASERDGGGDSYNRGGARGSPTSPTDHHHGEVSTSKAIRALSKRSGFLFFGACDAGEVLPTHPLLPDDIYTSCILNPVKMALLWFVVSHEQYTALHPAIAHLTPGGLSIKTDRQTPLFELNRVLSVLLECIAWCSLPEDTFFEFMRQDMMLPNVVRGHILATRILGSLGVSPVCCPAIPPRPCVGGLWEEWDDCIEQFLSGLLRAMVPPPTTGLSIRELRMGLDSRYATSHFPSHVTSGQLISVAPPPSLVPRKMHVHTFPYMGGARLLEGGKAPFSPITATRNTFPILPSALHAQARIQHKRHVEPNAAGAANTVAGGHGATASIVAGGVVSQAVGSILPTLSMFNDELLGMHTALDHMDRVRVDGAVGGHDAPSHSMEVLIDRLPYLFYAFLQLPYRAETLAIVARMCDYGPWLVHHLVRIQMFKMGINRLLTTAGSKDVTPEIEELLIFIYAKVLAIDSSVLPAAHHPDLVRVAYSVLERRNCIPDDSTDTAAPGRGGDGYGEGVGSSGGQVVVFGVLNFFDTPRGMQLLCCSVLLLLCQTSTRAQEACHERGMLGVACGMLEQCHDVAASLGDESSSSSHDDEEHSPSHQQQQQPTENGTLDTRRDVLGYLVQTLIALPAALLACYEDIPEDEEEEEDDNHTPPKTGAELCVGVISAVAPLLTHPWSRLRFAAFRALLVVASSHYAALSTIRVCAGLALAHRPQEGCTAVVTEMIAILFHCLRCHPDALSRLSDKECRYAMRAVLNLDLDEAHPAGVSHSRAPPPGGGLPLGATVAINPSPTTAAQLQPSSMNTLPSTPGSPLYGQARRSYPMYPVGPPLSGSPTRNSSNPPQTPTWVQRMSSGSAFSSHHHTHHHSSVRLQQRLSLSIGANMSFTEMEPTNSSSDECPLPCVRKVGGAAGSPKGSCSNSRQCEKDYCSAHHIAPDESINNRTAALLEMCYEGDAACLMETIGHLSTLSMCGCPIVSGQSLKALLLISAGALRKQADAEIGRLRVAWIRARREHLEDTDPNYDGETTSDAEILRGLDVHELEATLPPHLQAANRVPDIVDEWALTMNGSGILGGGRARGGHVAPSNMHHLPPAAVPNNHNTTSTTTSGGGRNNNDDSSTNKGGGSKGGPIAAAPPQPRGGLVNRLVSKFNILSSGTGEPATRAGRGGTTSMGKQDGHQGGRAARGDDARGYLRPETFGSLASRSYFTQSTNAFSPEHLRRELNSVVVTVLVADGNIRNRRFISNSLSSLALQFLNRPCLVPEDDTHPLHPTITARVMKNSMCVEQHKYGVDCVVSGLRTRHDLEVHTGRRHAARSTSQNSRTSRSGDHQHSNSNRHIDISGSSSPNGVRGLWGEDDQSSEGAERSKIVGLSLDFGAKKIAFVSDRRSAVMLTADDTFTVVDVASRRDVLAAVTPNPHRHPASRGPLAALACQFSVSMIGFSRSAMMPDPHQQQGHHGTATTNSEDGGGAYSPVQGDGPGGALPAGIGGSISVVVGNRNGKAVSGRGGRPPTATGGAVPQVNQHGSLMSLNPVSFAAGRRQPLIGASVRGNTETIASFHIVSTNRSAAIGTLLTVGTRGGCTLISDFGDPRRVRKRTTFNIFEGNCSSCETAWQPMTSQLHFSDPMGGAVTTWDLEHDRQVGSRLLSDSRIAKVPSTTLHYHSGASSHQSSVSHFSSGDSSSSDNGVSIHCIASHPTHPAVYAVGCGGGTTLLVDMRMQGVALRHSIPSATHRTDRPAAGTLGEVLDAAVERRVLSLEFSQRSLWELSVARNVGDCSVWDLRNSSSGSHHAPPPPVSSSISQTSFMSSSCCHAPFAAADWARAARYYAGKQFSSTTFGLTPSVDAQSGPLLPIIPSRPGAESPRETISCAALHPCFSGSPVALWGNTMRSLVSFGDFYNTPLPPPETPTPNSQWQQPPVAAAWHPYKLFGSISASNRLQFLDFFSPAELAAAADDGSTQT